MDHQGLLSFLNCVGICQLGQSQSWVSQPIPSLPFQSLCLKLGVMVFVSYYGRIQSLSGDNRGFCPGISGTDLTSTQSLMPLNLCSLPGSDPVILLVIFFVLQASEGDH